MRRLSIAVLIAVCAAVSRPAAARAQPSAQPIIVYKDPALATTLGVLITGGGQFYTGHVGRGLLEMATTGFGVSILTRSCSSDGANCEGNRDVGVALALAGWLWGIGTAGDDAREYNRRLQAEHAASSRRSDANGRVFAAWRDELRFLKPAIATR